MWDNNGDLLETSAESAKALNRLLCRPMKHLWIDSPEARARQGQVWKGEVKLGNEQGRLFKLLFHLSSGAMGAHSKRV